jgi:two-component system NtrC family sensor kinase
LKELSPTFIATIAPLLTSFLASSKVIHLALLGRDGRIGFASHALTEGLGADASKMTGRDFRDFVTAPDSGMISRWLSGDDPLPDDLFLLNLLGQDQAPYSIRCRMASVDEGFLLVAEPPQDVNLSLQKELLQLNNQLSVLSRENVRKGRELAKALDDLKKTQSMLVHQEKMASLGQMTAGIAHEINNPLAFVLGNEQVLKRDFADLLFFINTIKTALPEIASFSPRIHAEIIGKAGEVGLEYLTEAVPRKIVSNIEGLERVKRIVLDLRNFSRLDEAEQKYCHLAEGIESTLRFLGSLLQEQGVTVETDFAPLPELLCSPGPLNQAFSNILANAIQASQPGQTVRISTHMDGEWYFIEVADHGIGIPAEHLTKVFDPFFTTKPVGSGTGLGLSIAHQIVAAHDGRIEIKSLPGSGTTVRILLPNKQQSSVIDTGKILDKTKETETDRD